MRIEKKNSLYNDTIKLFAFATKLPLTNYKVIMKIARQKSVLKFS